MNNNIPLPRNVKSPTNPKTIEEKMRKNLLKKQIQEKEEELARITENA